MPPSHRIIRDTTLQLPSGQTISNPTPKQLRNALAALPQTTSADISLSLTVVIRDKVWYAAAHPDNSIVLTIFDYSAAGIKPPIWTEYALTNVTPDQVLEIWQYLRHGYTDMIHLGKWQLLPRS